VKALACAALCLSLPHFLNSLASSGQSATLQTRSWLLCNNKRTLFTGTHHSIATSHSKFGFCLVHCRHWLLHRTSFSIRFVFGLHLLCRTSARFASNCGSRRHIPFPYTVALPLPQEFFHDYSRSLAGTEHCLFPHRTHVSKHMVHHTAQHGGRAQ
jgi:hypothetical protein